MENIVVAFPFVPPYDSLEQLCLPASLRQFGGGLSDVVVWALTPESEVTNLSPQTQQEISRLDVRIVPYHLTDPDKQFPFASYVAAASAAEELAEGRTDLLAWLAPNTLVWAEPQQLVLPWDISVGYRPVHHKNIGSPLKEPLDPFWTANYNLCQVPDEEVFPMTTHIDGETVRPYINAGSLVVRPKKRFLRRWSDLFGQVRQKPQLTPFFSQNQLYEVFVHQTVLSCLLLTHFRRDQMQELPPTYNYPLHLHQSGEARNKLKNLDEVVTARHEGLGGRHQLENLPLTTEQKTWLGQYLDYLPSVREDGQSLNQ